MLRLLLNALLALVAARFLFGLFRWVGGNPERPPADPGRDPDDPTRAGGGSRARTGGAARSGVDRSTVIDVAFTEEEPETPAGSAAAGQGAGRPGAGTPEAERPGAGTPDLEAH